MRQLSYQAKQMGFGSVQQMQDFQNREQKRMQGFQQTGFRGTPYMQPTAKPNVNPLMPGNYKLGFPQVAPRPTNFGPLRNR